MHATNTNDNHKVIDKHHNPSCTERNRLACCH